VLSSVLSFMHTPSALTHQGLSAAAPEHLKIQVPGLLTLGKSGTFLRFKSHSCREANEWQTWDRPEIPVL